MWKTREEYRTTLGFLSEQLGGWTYIHCVRGAEEGKVGGDNDLFVLWNTGFCTFSRHYAEGILRIANEEQKIPDWPGAVVHICNPSYWKGKDWKDCSLRPVWAKN
jgi:hypothetical protein